MNIFADEKVKIRKIFAFLMSNMYICGQNQSL